MHTPESHIPVPYIKFNRNGDIISYSQMADTLFDMSEKKVFQLVDEDSRHKLYRFIFSENNSVRIEMNLLTRQKPISLFHLNANWDDDDFCHMVALPADDSNHRLAVKLSELQARLSDTDFELFEKKEQLIDAMKRLNELSGPFIPITDKLAFVPLFGDLSEEKMKAITGNAVKAAYEGCFETILFDFSAVGNISPGGIQKLHELLQILIYMGNPSIKIIGVKPSQAKALNHFGQNWPVDFEPTLKTALSAPFKFHMKQN